VRSVLGSDHHEEHIFSPSVKEVSVMTLADGRMKAVGR